MYKIIADTFSVAADSNHFIQVKNIKNPRSEDQLWVCIELIGESKFAKGTVQTIIDTLEETYFDHPEWGPYDRFENALKETNMIVNSLKEKRGVKSLGDISAIIAVMTGNELHLTQSKQAEAYLIRKGKLTLISGGLSSKSEDLFVNIASGEMMPEDRLIFSTSRLLRFATQHQLVQLFADGVTEAIDAIRELVLNDAEISVGVVCANTKLPQRQPVTLKLADVTEHPWLVRAREMVQRAVNFVSEKLGGQKRDMNKRTILLVLAGVFVLLAVSITALLQSSRNSAIRAEYSARLESMNEDLNTANMKGYANDKETANLILDKVEKEARDILASNQFREETLDLLNRTLETRDSINNTKRFKDLKPYANLAAKKETVDALGMVSLQDKLYAYEYNTLFEVILDQVLDPKAIDSNEVVIASAPSEDQGVIAFLTQAGKVIEFQDGQFHFATTDDQKWQPAVDVAAYGKYLYLLSPSKNQIYKYNRQRDKYSSGSEYNIDGKLDGAISFAIDGNVYILKQGGEIVKLFKSKAEPFQIADLGADLSETTKIFTLPEINNLYLLDPNHKRVVVVEKDKNGVAKYKSQLIFDDLADMKAIYVDKKEDSLYVLTGKAVYKVNI